MQIDNVMYACERIAGISAIPVRIYRGTQQIRVYSQYEMVIDPIKPYEEMIFERKESVSYCLAPFHQYYGVVRCEEYYLVFGPIGNNDYTEQEKIDFAFALGITQQEFRYLHNCLKQITRFPIENFLHMLLLVDFYFNDEKKELGDIITYLQQQYEITIPLYEEKQEQVRQDTSREIEISAHSALTYERQMLSYVKGGDTNGLAEFFRTQIHGSSGILASEQLRHLKNMFVVTSTLVSRAAMEGGMPEEEAMSLSDLYIQNCEMIYSSEAIAKLQYRMVMEYTTCVSELTNSKPLSELIAAVVTFIGQNLSTTLNVQEISRQLHVSRNTLDVKFKEEMGMTVKQYILSERIKKAKILLIHTERSLTDISAYLGFSSQSHFQKRFKEKSGMTPLEYRRTICESEKKI